MKKLLIIIPWVLVLILSYFVWWNLNSYTPYRTAKIHSGIYPIVLENDQILLYYNNWAETLTGNKEFELKFYKLNENNTWEVKGIKPPFNEPHLGLYRSKDEPEIFSTSNEARQAVKWNYLEGTLEIISMDKLPSKEHMIPLIAAYEDFAQPYK